MQLANATVWPLFSVSVRQSSEMCWDTTAIKMTQKCDPKVTRSAVMPMLPSYPRSRHGEESTNSSFTGVAPETSVSLIKSSLNKSVAHVRQNLNFCGPYVNNSLTPERLLQGEQPNRTLLGRAFSNSVGRCAQGITLRHHPSPPRTASSTHN